MYKLISLFVVATIIVSCSPASQLEPTATPENTTTIQPTKTQIPSPTFTPTLIPTPTLFPDVIIDYQFDSDVDPVYQDLIKEGVQMARYYFLYNFGSDISNGITVIAKNRSQTREGFVAYPPGTNPYLYLDTSEDNFTQCLTPDFSFHCKSHVAGELTLYWLWEHGCKDKLYDDIITTFIPKGLEGNVALKSAGVTDDHEWFSDGYALRYWQMVTYNANDWLQTGDVARVAVKHLIDEHGIMAFAQLCDAVGNGESPYESFQSIFGISIQDFREKFMVDVLGTLKDCTVATCGAGVDNFSDQYQIGHLIDRTKTTPNLIVHFVDQNNEPVILTHVNTLKQNTGTFWDYAQPVIVPGVFSQAMLPGKYAFFFCEPGYPTNQNTANCQYHETEWFDVFSDKVTELTFQLPIPIEDLSLSQPNLHVTFFDQNGNPVPNIELVICSDEDSVKACSNPFSGDRKTDSNGVYSDYLRSGKYVLRVFTTPTGGFSPMYQIPDIEIKDSESVQLEFHFLPPNLVIKLTDVNGSPIPGHELFLCRIVDGIGDCSSDIYLHGTFIYTDANGIVQGKVDPGEYYILTCTIYCNLNPPEFIFEDIIVVDSQVTNVEFTLSK